MQNIMIDLETWGSCPGCGIVSIGAVAFCPINKTVDGGYYIVVGRESCQEVYLAESDDTKAWWAKQAEEAKQVLALTEDVKASVPVKLALEQLNRYVGRYGGFKNCKVWGNGADFDNAILAAAYDACDMKPAWAFWNNRCYRTIKNLAPDIKIVREGTYHNALDDARSQVSHLFQVVEAKGLVLA